MNNDLHNDIIISSIQSNEVFILYGHSNGNFEKQTLFLNTSAYSLLIVDINNDKLLDFVTCESYRYIHVYPRNSNCTYGSPIRTILNNYRHKIFELYTGDFNHDNILDLVVTTVFQEQIYVLIGDGNGNFPIQNRIIIPMRQFGIPSFFINDINNDSHIDIIITYLPQIYIFICFGNVYGIFDIKMFYNLPDALSPNSVILNDFNNDGKLEFIILYSYINAITLINTIDYENFNSVLEYSINIYVNIQVPIYTTDFNGDGNQDIIGYNPETGSIIALLGNGYGSFKNETIFPREHSIEIPFVINDMNNDNYKDIIIYNPNLNPTIEIISHTNEC
uniref:RTX toxin-like protein n=1 Tax=Adineta vaga TaxID=104782 RepID=B3G4C5_ADIVA|nr:RTX toxin-like protein [Adineta vaga]